MSLTDIPVFDVLRTKMRWHQVRQGVLAENVANADTPGYRARELATPRFEELVSGAEGRATVAAVTTDAAHIAPAAARRSGDGFDVKKADGWETTPSGNAVVLEEEMMKLAANQMDHQAAVSLYRKSIGLIRMALGRPE